MTTKSARVQFTPLVNCIAIKGIDNMRPVASAIQMKILFCMIVSTLFAFTEPPPF